MRKILPRDSYEAEDFDIWRGGAVRPAPEILEPLILAHQRRVDEARNRGELVKGEPYSKHAQSAPLRPGWENTPRGIKLGYDSSSEENRARDIGRK